MTVKCLEQLVRAYINNIDPFLFANHSNRSVEDAVSLALPTVLEHLEGILTGCTLVWFGNMAAQATQLIGLCLFTSETVFTLRAVRLLNSGT